VDRRKYLKTFAVGSVGAAALIQSCTDKQNKGTKKNTTISPGPDRQPEEIERYNNLISEKFFSEHEMATIAVLADIIIPRDDKSGSATDAGVPDFIEFIVKDKSHYQTPVRGGLRWLDVQCMKRYNSTFVNCSTQHQIDIK
jgi:Gluconate 2-dehydrogenase subunit 3